MVLYKTFIKHAESAVRGYPRLGLSWVSFVVACWIWGTLPTVSWAQSGLEAFPKINAEKDWPWWRGVQRNGHSANALAPTSISETENLDWSTPIPGRGHSSPIVVGDRIYLITAEDSKQTHSAIALDRKSGSIVWSRVLNQGGFPKKNHPKNTEASPTLACDGERLYVSLFHHLSISAVALSLDGEKLWEKKLGVYDPKMFEYGYAPSPVLYGDSVIFAFEYDGPSALIALNRTDGNEKWRTTRKESITFSSPVVTSYMGVDYLLISGVGSVSAYNPATGQQRWSTPGTTMATCGTMVWDDGICFASGGFPKAETIAIDVMSGKVRWRNNQKAYEQSMIATGGHLYSLTDSGVLYCWEGKSGTEMWKQRLAGPVSASGVLVGDKIYWANEAGQLWVFQADPTKYIGISKNQIGDEAFASPAICGDQIFLRVAKSENGNRQEYLMRFSSR